MASRNTTRAACGFAGLVVLAGGFWGGRSIPTSSATPRVETGTVVEVGINRDEFAIRLAGGTAITGYGLPSTVLWEDAAGSWNDGSRPDCMQPLSRGQRITIGVVSVQPEGGVPGGPIVVWLECLR